MARSLNTHILSILFVGSLASQAAQSQDVFHRDLTSPSAAFPHQMMHFGKRVATSEPPTTDAIDAYKKMELQQLQPEQQPQLQPDGYPYLLTIELESGQTLQPVPDEPVRNLVHAFDRPQLELAIRAAEQEHRKASAAHNILANQQLLRLIGADQSGDADDKSGKATLVADTQESQHVTNNESDKTRQHHQATIKVKTRTTHPGLGTALYLPKAYISNLLFGRPGSSRFGANYNKKAEQKDEFIHFGRK